MSSERTARFSERAYGRFIGLGWFIMGIVILKVLASVLIFLKSWRCEVPQWAEWRTSAPQSVCYTASLFPNWIVALIVFVVGLAIALWAFAERDYWYREVRKGTITGFSWYSEAGFYSSGYQEYYITVEGATRQGEIRRYRHSVQPKTYHDFKKGDTIDFD